VTVIGSTIRRNSSIALAYVVAVVLFLVGTGQATGFASPAHIRTILVTASFVGFVGFGQTLCMLTGGIDLSIPSTLAGSAVVTAFLANGSTGALIWIIPLVMAGGAFIGLINGLGVAYAGVPPIIMTLGMNGAVQGLLLVYTNGGLVSSPPTSLINFVDGDTLGIPNTVLIWVVVAVLATVLLSWSVFGRKLYAVGTNPVAAYLAGVNVKRVLLVPYIISGMSAAFAGVLLLGFYGQAFTNMGDDFLFASAIAVAVGGASILGGRGHYIGTVAGAIILTLITANLDLLSLGQDAVDISYGVILLLTVFLASFRLERRARQGGIVEVAPTSTQDIVSPPDVKSEA
jgi:ribose transport system permease protein